MKYLSLLISVIFLLTTFNAVHAQNAKVVRVIYDFTFQTDTTHPESKIKDQYALDIFDKHSKFVSLAKLKRDSYIDSMMKTVDRQGGMGNMRNVNINFSTLGINSRVESWEIYKTNNAKINFQQRFMRSIYAYEEDMSNLAWQILDSAATYNKYECQLATVNYGGRNWYALFTTEVPINNGPYKFMGLPGLIVKMWDNKNECLYELAELKNIDDGNDKIPSAELVKKSEFKKVEENAKTQMMQMVSGMRNNSNMQAVITIIKDQNGNEISMEDMMRKRAEAEKKNNNHIEKL